MICSGAFGSGSEAEEKELSPLLTPAPESEPPAWGKEPLAPPSSFNDELITNELERAQEKEGRLWSRARLRFFLKASFPRSLGESDLGSDLGSEEPPPPF